MRYLNVTIVFLAFLLSQCSSTKTAESVREIQPKFLANYTINPAPNGLDSVGIVFSIDSKGSITTVGNLNLPINQDSITVPQEVSAKNVSFKFLVDFLSIKNLDSTTRLQIRDSVKLNTNFRIDNGVFTRFDPNVNLLDAFNAKRNTIISNIKFLGLQKSKLFLIMEAIKSSQVNLSNISNVNFGFDAEAKFKKLLSINPDLALSKIQTNSLVYSTNVPRVIFYKLRVIDIEIDKTKGTNDAEIDVSLTDSLQTSTLY